MRGNLFSTDDQHTFLRDLQHLGIDAYLEIDIDSPEFEWRQVRSGPPQDPLWTVPDEKAFLPLLGGSKGRLYYRTCVLDDFSIGYEVFKA